ncbi:MAG: SDR family NAD(P)-dependent oxidoreductase [Alteraurantiacibacter sp. bin_em_oilr2.035]|nr:SDR family NAD(P)-dependent oxidoreductase [Alteraurantiacibacter sp. bin_em_oilr2.035]
MTLDLRDRVAIVTGGSAGLGRSHALLLAKRGAKVVVNGRNRARVDTVVEEIRSAGGEAVASYDSVERAEGAEAIVATAIATYDKVDILVNNAGFLRDRSFLKAELEDVEAVIRVHLLGTINCSKAVWPLMNEQAYGRIVMTTSMAATSGNFGQCAYGAAKAGVLGLMNCLSLEGRKRNVLVNAISPVAATGMTEGMFDEDTAEAFRSELVSPAVAWLASERCDVSGHTFTAGGGAFGRIHYFETAGVRFGNEEPATVEAFDAQFQAIDSLTGAEECEIGSRMRAAFPS